jgi:histidine triad (HIT) family protein
MPSIFTRIIEGEIPCHKVYEDDAHLAFLDINPIQPGHTLVVPKAEVGYLFDMEPAAYDELWRAVRKVEKALRAVTECTRVVIEVVGYEVDHTHIHLIPTHSIEDYPIPPRRSLDDGDAARFASEVRQRI